MPLFGKISEFQDGQESFLNYEERLVQFFEANEVPDEELVPVFLSVIGSTAYGVLKNLVAPALPKDKSYADLVKLLKNHYNPKPLTISERFKFNKRNQKEGETVSEYVVELKRLSTHCDFGTFLNDALRDRFVCGLRSETIQKKLLAEEELSFDQAIKISTAMEMAEKDTVSFGGMAAAAVNKVKIKSRPVSTPSEPKPVKTPMKKNGCYRCGGNHRSDSCMHKKSKCYNCGKIGHLANNCRNRQFAKNTNFVEESSDEELTLFVYSNSESKSNHPFKVNFMLDNEDVLFELDTGSSRTLINEQTYRAQLGGNNLRPTNIKLKSYSGQSIDTLGEITVSSEGKLLTAVVVKGNRPNLLGRDWLKQIKLDWKTIFASVNKVDSSDPVETMKQKFSEVFVKNDKPILGFKATIHLKENSKPWFHKARPVPYALKDKVTEELKILEKDGVIERVDNSSWASPLVVVPKADKKSLRLCGDYKVSVNREISEDQYPLPNIDDMFATLAGGKKFTKLDLTQAYAQLELDENSKDLLTINTHLGLYKYNRLAYGVSSAPAIFQSVMDTVLAGLSGVVCRIDDILITAPSDDVHLQRLEEVLRRLHTHNIKLNANKCVFMAKNVVFMGHLVDEEGIHPTDDKVEAVMKAPVPTDVGTLKSYLGLLNYYGSFIPNLSTMLHPLHQLLRKGAKWEWSAECQEAFDRSKDELSGTGVLIHYDEQKPVILACDASAYGVGAVISHVMEDGTEKPIAYASRTLAPAERNYSQVEKEALGIVFGVKKFHKYLYGRKFSLLTDHTALTTIFGPTRGIPTLAASRLQRWAILLSGYQYDIKYRKSSAHGNCDGLSRLPVTSSEVESTDDLVSFIEELPVEARVIADATRKCPILSKVIDFVLSGWPKHNDDPKIRPYFSKRFELGVDRGVLLWGLRVIIPETLRNTILSELHDQHLGVNRMKSLARGYVWWPNLDSELEHLAATCGTCQSLKALPAEAPLHPWVRASRPMERIHIDFADFKNHSFLILIDNYSKWLEVIPMKSTTSENTIDKLRSIFSYTGLPEQLVSDNGPQFTSVTFKDFVKTTGIRHTLTPPYHPSSNGQAERAVQVVKNALKARIKDNAKSVKSVSLTHLLADFLLKYRITPHTTTGIAPCELFMNRQLRTRLSLVKPSKDSKVKDSQMKMKAVHDKSTKMRTFEKGDQVAVKSTIQGGKWEWRPGVIHKVLGAVSYLVKCNNRIRYCHIDHLVTRHAELPFSETCSVPSNDLVAPDVHDNHKSVLSECSIPTTETPVEVSSLPPGPVSLPGEPSNPPSPSVPSTESTDSSPVNERPKRTIKTPRKLKDYVWEKR
ncbi:uncharacterized protein K02A2.6-like [Mercenaria mercenaria]|uniref:uncharacterized protein K02A2.6-like n=1 Tax=Mercenaria mercenaria TaxID=6596 RepID=UPI00234F7A73|nr:uncharacterized protein K02A2.6-like [Mercenaria mercenaria]